MYTLLSLLPFSIFYIYSLKKNKACTWIFFQFLNLYYRISQVKDVKNKKCINFEDMNNKSRQIFYLQSFRIFIKCNLKSLWLKNSNKKSFKYVKVFLFLHDTHFCICWKDMFNLFLWWSNFKDMKILWYNLSFCFRKKVGQPITMLFNNAGILNAW